MTNLTLSRRSLLASGAALPLSAAVAPTLANAAGHAAPPNAAKHSFAIGDFQVSTMLVGSRVVEDPQGTFAMNVDKAEFERVNAENFLPNDKVQFFFTPTVINTGSEVVLFDTGFAPEGTLPPLAASGISAEDVDVVVITHMHGDHINGLTDANGTPTYPNARYVTGQVEFDAWAQMDNEGFETKVRPLAEKTRFIGGGDSVVSGITAVEAFGHTPGHMVYMIDSGGEQLMILADLA
ncbi:MAG: MBL fold metallo-hydrolase, partial [Pseudomonadota bacterium]